MAGQDSAVFDRWLATTLPLEVRHAGTEVDQTRLIDGLLHHQSCKHAIQAVLDGKRRVVAHDRGCQQIAETLHSDTSLQYAMLVAYAFEFQQSCLGPCPDQGP